METAACSGLEINWVSFVYLFSISFRGFSLSFVLASISLPCHLSGQLRGGKSTMFYFYEKRRGEEGNGE